MNLDLTDTEAPALIALLKHAIADDRYPLSERVQTWQGILDKLSHVRPAPSQHHLHGSTPRRPRADIAGDVVKMSTEDFTGLQLGMATLCLQDALVKCLLQLAAHHGNQAGPWLDTLERQIITETKNTDFHTPGDLDADVTRAALQYVQGPFDNVRKKLQGAV
jgi:hypothetical protein